MSDTLDSMIVAGLSERIREEREAKTSEREAILTALAAFIKQRSGMDWRNYASSGADRDGIRMYQHEAREVTRDLHDARELLAAVRWRASIGVTELREAFRAFSGRLSWHAKGETCETCKGEGTLGPERRTCYTCKASGVYADNRLDYCTGQYFPTEYRKAACAVLAHALWYYWRASMTPDRTTDAMGGETYGGLSFGAAIQRKAAQELSRGVARRWFK